MNEQFLSKSHIKVFLQEIFASVKSLWKEQRQ